MGFTRIKFKICGDLTLIMLISVSKRAYVYFMNGDFDKNMETVPCILTSSLFSGVLAIYLTQPLDTLRCRIQTRYFLHFQLALDSQFAMHTLSGTRGLHFKGIQVRNGGECASHLVTAYHNAANLVKVEGMHGLLRKGFLARLLSTGPDLMGGIISYELFIKWLSGSYL